MILKVKKTFYEFFAKRIYKKGFIIISILPLGVIITRNLRNCIIELNDTK